MSYLKGLGLSNFRGFENEFLEFAPITIFTGPNNSGKSSFLKALLLLADNVKKKLLPPSYEERLGESGFSHYVKELFTELDDLVDSGDYIPESEYHEFFNPSILTFDNSSHDLGNAFSVKSWNSEGNTIAFTIPYMVNSNTLLYKLEFDINTTAQSNHNLLILTQDEGTILKITDHLVEFDLDSYNKLVKSDFFVRTHSPEHKKLIERSSRISLKDWFFDNGYGQISNNLVDTVFKALGLKVNFNGSIECVPIYNHLRGIDFLATSRNDQKRIYRETDRSSFVALLKKLHQALGEDHLENLFEGLAAKFGIKESIGSLYEQEKGSYFPNINGKALTNFGFGYTQIFSLLAKIVLHGNKNFGWIVQATEI